MAEISGFSNFLSQLDRYLQPGTATLGQSLPVADLRDSPGSVLLPSDSPGASFESGREIEDSGAYQPPSVQSGHRFGMALGLEFNLTIQREARVVTQDRAPRRQRAFIQAMEQTRLSYQSSMISSRKATGSSFTEMRSFQADLFYNRTRELSAQLDHAAADRMESTSQKVVRTFELDISLEASFLSQFVGQSGEISSMDSDLFGKYLDNTDRLAESQGLQVLFNDVDKILEEAEAMVQDALGSLFDEVSATFGLTSEEAGSLQGVISDEVAAFFNDVDQMLSDTRQILAGFDAEPAIGPAEGESDPLLV